MKHSFPLHVFVTGQHTLQIPLTHRWEKTSHIFFQHGHNNYTFPCFHFLASNCTFSISLTLSFLSLSFSLSLRGACSPGDMPGFQFTVGRASGTPKKMGGRVSITPAENGQPHSARESSLRHPACPRALLLSTAAFRHALYRSYLSPSSLSQILSLFLSLSPLSWSL